MPENRFAIRCPNCLEWTEFNVDPASILLSTAEELRDILRDLNADPEEFAHPKLLRCGKAGWDCPASFEAFVCPSVKEASELLVYPDAWSIRRAFSLRKSPHGAHWGDAPGEPKYHAILFCTQPVQRQRDIELAQLLDEALLSESIVGMASKLQAPVTIYGARVLEVDGERRTFWSPIEGFSAERTVSPPKYTPFCKAVRECIRAELVQEHLASVAVAGRSAASCSCGLVSPSLRQGRLMHCPQFLEILDEACPCYHSDLEMIQRVEAEFRRGQSPAMVVDRCWAGCTEIAIGLVTHDHLVGVAMTGQYVTSYDEIRIRDETLKRYPRLARCGQFLAAMDAIQQGTQRGGGTTEIAQFCGKLLSRQDVRDKQDRLLESVRLVEPVAETRYRQWRDRTETAFQEELIGLIDNAKRSSRGVSASLLPALVRRMAEFWAFKRAHLLVQPPAGAHLEVAASYPPPGKLPERIPLSQALPSDYPRLWFHEVGAEPRRNWEKLLHGAMQDMRRRNELDIGEGLGILFALVPLGERVIVFVFCERNEAECSNLSKAPQPHVSEIARDVILQTCRAVGERLRDVWYRQDMENTLSGLTHTFRFPIHVMRGPLAMLARELDRVPQADRKRLRWLLDSGKSAVRAGDLGAEIAMGEINKLAVGLDLGQRLGRIDRETVQLRPLVEKLIQPFSFLCEPIGTKTDPRRSTLTWQTDFDELVIGEVLADLELLSISIYNVLDNAYKYSARGTEIKTSCSTTEDGKHNIIRVRNVGLAVDKDEAHMITHKNYRGRHARAGVERRIEGTGLGLFLVNGIIEALDGTFSFELDPLPAETLKGYMQITATISLPIPEDHNQ